YRVIRYPLDVARPAPGERIDLWGDSLTAYTNGTLAGCFIRLDSPSADAIPINEFNPYKYTKGWTRFYLETTAQAGRYLRLHIGREASAEASVQITATAPTPAFYTVRSDKDVHFTGAIVTNAKEDENLAGLLSSKIRIVGLAIQSDQQLHYRAIFWRKDTFEDADLDVDAFISEQELDLVTIGYQIAGAGQWYAALTSLNIDYEDEDETSELHISLQNLSAAAKIAGAAGEVTLLVAYELRA
ncbi:unnamed protein product, partial [marine sediment metagenome]